MSFEIRSPKHSFHTNKEQRQSECSFTTQAKTESEILPVKKFQRSNSRQLKTGGVNNTFSQRPSYDSSAPLQKSNSSHCGMAYNYNSPKSVSSSSHSQKRFERFENNLVMKDKFIPVGTEKSMKLGYDVNNSVKIIENQQCFPFRQLVPSCKTVASPLNDPPSCKSIKVETRKQLNTSFRSPKFSENQKIPYVEVKNQKERDRNLHMIRSVPIGSPHINVEYKQENRKVAQAIQTQPKKTVSVATTTISPKYTSSKVQTVQSGKTYETTIQNLQNIVNNLQKQNQQLQQKINELLSIQKGKKGDIRQFNRTTSFVQNQQNLSKTFGQCLSPSNANFVSNRKRQIQLEQEMKELRQQILHMKNNKFEEIINEIKSQNALLLKQFNSISFKCRILQQSNNQMQSLEQENRKLRTQIKYLKQFIKENSCEIQRLKGQNKKLRMNHFAIDKGLDGSRFCPWGSETDSLNLSISIVRD